MWSRNKRSGVTAFPGDLVCVFERFYSRGKRNQASALCPCGKVCLGPLRRESLFLFSFPTPHCLQLPSRLSYFLNLS